MTAQAIDPKAFGSDVARSQRQYWTRKAAHALVRLLGLNGSGALATEIVQAMEPVARIATRHGEFVCRAGHGRLVWRAETFHTEEPDTVEWLDTLGKDDVLWDVGANVGLYSLYAARFGKCRVVAFEPEAQNFALLMENVALNKIEHRVTASNIALSEWTGVGSLKVRYITKGGAFNHFAQGGDIAPTESLKLAQREGRPGLEQLVYGSSADLLVSLMLLPCPTHLKIDVDGIEPKIIAGCGALLQNERLRSVLIELNLESLADREVPRILESHDFRKVEYGKGKPSTKRLSPMVNMVFER